jgi:hypothetical protein
VALIAFCAKAKLQTLIMKVMQAENVSAVRNRAPQLFERGIRVS